ncbi:chemokine (C-X-C motif) ligand 18a, duplicate 1 [Triplophysa rosa]|uniref:C-X-C motif chemokine 3 n=1 Tax=Triplophysa rosa TaxID=992332 RepID=A0A9W7WPB9_TRIRA|nr:chemokine (C-X-C motif) ligand 18a, duplicate 1 [Triplophysa rosa]KAI7805912.1 putative C-X-C motif chemokine 3 [Triplophysa rosa]
MALQASVSLLLFVVFLNIVTDNRTTATSIREKCQCIEETEAVRWKKVTDFTIIPKDPLCNKIQIILQLSDIKSCLKPDSKPGKQLQRCWKRIKFNTERKKVCLKSSRKKKPKEAQTHQYLPSSV